jgi:hypothetical protein
MNTISILNLCIYTKNAANNKIRDKNLKLLTIKEWPILK